MKFLEKESLKRMQYTHLHNLLARALEHSDEVIKMLNDLRGQRDTALECNEHWTVLQGEHLKRLEQLEANRTARDTLEETNTRLREEVLSLKGRLKEGQRSADQPLPRQPTEPRATTDHPTEPQAPTEDHIRRETSKSSKNGHHKSYEFPDPPIFGEGEPTWEGWRNMMDDKLLANSDQFGDETICIAYMISRLGGDAAEHTFARRRFDSTNPFHSTTYELFDHLEGIYGEIDKNRKCHREYNALRQTGKPFNVFYSDFMKLFSYLGYDDRILMNDLQDKINNRLQNALSVCFD